MQIQWLLYKEIQYLYSNVIAISLLLNVQKSTLWHLEATMRTKNILQAKALKLVNTGKQLRRTAKGAINILIQLPVGV